MIMFCLSPHAAGIKQMFSVMRNMKPKGRNRMQHTKLTMLARSKLLLTDQKLSSNRVILSAEDVDQFAAMSMNFLKK
jgi:hypothetical protein